MKVCELPLEEDVVMVRTRDVARTAGPRAALQGEEGAESGLAAGAALPPELTRE
jgi:hypothetical protein